MTHIPKISNETTASAHTHRPNPSREQISVIERANAQTQTIADVANGIQTWQASQPVFRHTAKREISTDTNPKEEKAAGVALKTVERFAKSAKGSSASLGQGTQHQQPTPKKRGRPS